MRYSQIDRRMWNDQKFRRLSPIPPCGQGLWVYLLSTPFLGNIPGLIHAGEAALAEALGWDVKDFRKAFQEALDLGLAKADFEARLIWLPNAIFYNPPQSPNVVISWLSFWDELPECSLKDEAEVALRNALTERGEAFLKAFAKIYNKDYRKTSTKTMAKQEQEQEQEQKNLAEQTPLGIADTGLTAENPVVLDLPTSNGKRFTITAAMVESWTADFPSKDVLSEIHKSRAWLEGNPKRRKTLAGMNRFIVNWLLRAEDKQNGKPSVGKKEYKDATEILADKRRRLERARSEG